MGWKITRGAYTLRRALGRTYSSDGVGGDEVGGTKKESMMT